MTDNEDSKIGVAVQPPTDRPLTAGDWAAKADALNAQAKEMREMLHRLGVANTRTITDGALAVEFVRLIGTPACPATSAASEVTTQACVDWDDYADDIGDVISDSLEMDWTSSDGAKAVVRWLNENAPYSAALASPPVSERERELASALEPFANLGVTSGPEDEPCSIPYRITRGSILRARKALTAQPAGEG